MIVYAYTTHHHYDVCKECVLRHEALFDEKPGLLEDGSSLRLDYATDELKPYWKSWLKAAKKVGLIYGWKIK